VALGRELVFMARMRPARHRIAATGMSPRIA
jgi:hypothetical protein